MHRPNLRALLSVVPLAVLFLGGSGCVNLASNILYAINGNKNPAAYPGFKGKKVAIVCGNEKGLSNDATSTLMTRYVEDHLSKNVKDITIIRQDDVDKWLNARESNASDYGEIGKGVGADQVLAINITNLTLRDGMTLYKGKADISVTVYDVADDGRVVYRRSFSDFEFPRIGGPTVTDMTDARFRAMFLTVASKQIAALFYDADPNEQFAIDAISNSF